MSASDDFENIVSTERDVSKAITTRKFKVTPPPTGVQFKEGTAHYNKTLEIIGLKMSEYLVKGIFKSDEIVSIGEYENSVEVEDIEDDCCTENILSYDKWSDEKKAVAGPPGCDCETYQRKNTSINVVNDYYVKLQMVNTKNGINYGLNIDGKLISIDKRTFELVMKSEQTSEVPKREKDYTGKIDYGVCNNDKCPWYRLKPPEEN